MSIHSRQNGGGILKGIADWLRKEEEGGGKLKVSRPLTEGKNSHRHSREGRATCAMKWTQQERALPSPWGIDVLYEPIATEPQLSPICQSSFIIRPGKRWQNLIDNGKFSLQYLINKRVKICCYLWVYCHWIRGQVTNMSTSQDN